MKKKTWQFINKSVCGASHLRKNTPCQDYSLCVSGEGGKPPVILTVSDGHGGSRYVRSAQGAVFACEAAVEVAECYAGTLESAAPNIIQQLAETRIKLDIIKGWRTRVLQHARQNSFSEEELSLLGVGADEYEQALATGEADNCVKILAAYGATLLTVIILDNVIITEQIGDGDILFYNSKTKSARVPVPADERILGNETTSLCSLKAPFYMRHNVDFSRGAESPDLLMLSSDGYVNSFASVSDYHKAAEDFHALINGDGRAFVEENIENWLIETSREGSGDDVTLVVAWRG